MCGDGGGGGGGPIGGEVGESVAGGWDANTAVGGTPGGSDPSISGGGSGGSGGGGGGGRGRGGRGGKSGSNVGSGFSYGGATATSGMVSPGDPGSTAVGASPSGSPGTEGPSGFSGGEQMARPSLTASDINAMAFDPGEPITGEMVDSEPFTDAKSAAKAGSVIGAILAGLPGLVVGGSMGAAVGLGAEYGGGGNVGDYGGGDPDAGGGPSDPYSPRESGTRRKNEMPENLFSLLGGSTAAAGTDYSPGYLDYDPDMSFSGDPNITKRRSRYTSEPLTRELLFDDRSDFNKSLF